MVYEVYHETHRFSHLSIHTSITHYKGLVINYGEGGGGATKWENSGSETFCAPPPTPPHPQAGLNFLLPHRWVFIGKPAGGGVRGLEMGAGGGGGERGRGGSHGTCGRRLCLDSHT